MLAFDFPPDAPIAVEYIGLSKSSAGAETQKDVLRRVLAELVSGTGEIVEVDAIRKQKSFSELYIKCLQCDVKDELTDFTLNLEEEESFRALNNLQRSQFKIQIRRASGNSHKSQQELTWKIEIGTRKSAWFPALKLDLLPADGRLNSKNFTVQSCIEGVNCPNTKLYRSLAEAGEQIKLWANRRIDATSSSLNMQRSAYLIPEKIPFVTDVRASSAVRITVLSNDSSLSIKAHGRALRNGIVGDFIPVEILPAANSATKGRQVNAKVISEGEVQIVR